MFLSLMHTCIFCQILYLQFQAAENIFLKQMQQKDVICDNKEETGESPDPYHTVLMYTAGASYHASSVFFNRRKRVNVVEMSGNYDAVDVLSCRFKISYRL